MNSGCRVNEYIIADFVITPAVDKNSLINIKKTFAVIVMPEA
jgi:hypothetical protein